MKRFVLTLLAALVAVFTMAVTAGAQQSYTDPAGDAGAGTDITSITVSNDQAGLITMQIASASPIVGNHAIAVFIDADKNPATGDDGDEAWMFGGPLVGAAFFSCNSGGCTPTTPAGFRARAASSNVTEFQFPRSAIGDTTSFNFVVVSISIDPPNINFWDGAGTFTYDLVFPQCGNGRDDDGDGKIDSQDLGCSSATDDNEADDPVNIRLGAAKVTPRTPKAGSTVVISARTTRVETGQPLDGGAVACTASYAGGKQLRSKGSVAAGNAVCRLKIPAGAKGKTVRGSMTVTYKTAQAKTPFSFRGR
jgi:hypothetical protein